MRKNKNIPLLPRPVMQIKSCGSKKKYRTRHEADNTAQIQMLQNMDIELLVYKCTDCMHWHLTRDKINSK